MEKGFDLLALNKDFEIVSLLNYTILQWTRKYFETGTFSIEIPTEIYNKEFKYIYTNDRPELGRIEQTNYYVNEGEKKVVLSGYFLENDLNNRVVYPYGGKTNILNIPTWTTQKGKAEDVAYKFFNDFKDVTFTQNGQTINANLGILSSNSQSRGNDAEHTRNGENLGDKIYSILKPSLMSYRVKYDFATSEIKFEVWKGLDRTQDNIDQNNPIIFSTTYGNIVSADLLIDEKDYKNSAIIIKEKDDDSLNSNIIAYENIDESDLMYRFTYLSSSNNESDYSTRSEYISVLNAESYEELKKYEKTISLDFETVESSYVYMSDFELGDVCSIEIPELGISIDAVLSGLYEVVKKGVWNMTLEFTQL